ncbi:unnamed protein product [Hymenolepis diminuta]|uniref:Uncharacterized protein n=1 Tax=Hymenolepis diminuta TaxID=6216 RepID=A0A564Z491_HYMDI|nr:unnamed protein product [Hymenolepis diminuta]
MPVSHVLGRGRQFMWTKTTQEIYLMRAKGLLDKLKDPEERECLWFFAHEITSTRMKMLIEEMASGRLCTVRRTPLKFQLLGMCLIHLIRLSKPRIRWTIENFHHHTTPNLCLPPNYSSNLNPFDHYVWSGSGWGRTWLKRKLIGTSITPNPPL